MDMPLLDGVKVFDIIKRPDERGSFTEILRSDWKDLIGDDIIEQTNLSISFPGTIRAWHKHERGQVDYFFVIKGSVKICVYDDNPHAATCGQIDEIVLSGEVPKLVRVPGFYWHGTKTIGNEISFVVYFVNRLYDYSNPDELRRPWNDPSIINKKTKQPFDWNAIPFK